jgi:hypothetical protein
MDAAQAARLRHARAEWRAHRRPGPALNHDRRPLSGDVLAGTVSVHCSTDGRATRAEVTYDLTALTKTAQAALQQFADGYDNFLSEWERRIATAREREPGPDGT